MAVDTSLAPASQEPQGSQERHGPRLSKNKIIASIATLATGLVATGVLVYRGISGDGPERSAATPTISRDQTPGTNARPSSEASPSSSSSPNTSPSSIPSSTPSEALSPLDQQKELFQKVTLPETVMSYDFLNEYTANPSVLDIYRGVDGGKGLYPEIDRRVNEVRQELGQIEPSDLRAHQTLTANILSGTYTDIVDGKPVSMTADKFFDTGLGLPLSRESIDATLEDAETAGASKSKILGMLLLSAAKSSAVSATEKAMSAETKVVTWNIDFPDKPATLSTVNSATVAELGFIGHGGVQSDRVNKFMDGVRGGASEQIDFDTIEILEPHLTPLRTADGVDTEPSLGVVVHYKLAGNPNTVHIASIGFVPAENVLKQNEQGKWTIQPGEGQFYACIADEVTFDLATK